MLDLDAIRERHAQEDPAHQTHLRIGWRSHLEIGQLLKEVDRLRAALARLYPDPLGYHDPRSDHIRERTQNQNG